MPGPDWYFELRNNHEHQEEILHVERQIKMLRLVTRIDVQKIYKELWKIDPNDSLGRWQIAEKLVEYLLQDFIKKWTCLYLKFLMH
jgi:hypothetical protein